LGDGAEATTYECEVEEVAIPKTAMEVKCDIKEQLVGEALQVHLTVLVV
jgi:hypothetical protein